MSQTLTSQVIKREELSQTQLIEMRTLFDDFYLSVTKERFEKDLGEKDWVLLLLDIQTRGVQGFSTLSIYERLWKDQSIGVVYSGDTILRPIYWGTFELPRAWIKAVMNLTTDIARPLYWLLISSGYKTYRMLPAFYKKFYPRFDQPTPPDSKALIDYLAVDRFGNRYDPQTGIVKLGTGATPLKSGVAEITTSHTQDPHIAFFARQNPGYLDGDELVCLALIDPRNFTELGFQMMQ